MFDFLASLLKPVYAILDWIRKQFNLFWIWISSLLIVLLAPLAWFFDLLTSWFIYLGTILDKIQAIINKGWSTVEQAAGSLSGVFAIANYLVPIDHIFIALGALLVLWVLALIYRAIKSYVPTLS